MEAKPSFESLPALKPFKKTFKTDLTFSFLGGGGSCQKSTEACTNLNTPVKAI